MSNQKIIRTIEQLEALDTDTLVIDSINDYWNVGEACHWDGLGDVEYWDALFTDSLPAVVIATGDRVRAARKALEEQA